jgi:hypothetical protein
MKESSRERWWTIKEQTRQPNLSRKANKQKIIKKII